MSDLIHANCLFLAGNHKAAFDEYMDILESSIDARAASNIGYMYHRGISVMRDFGKAMAFYNAARDLDGGVACFNMAIMHLRGQGCEVDFVKAVNLMQRSAHLGCINAKLYLALAHILGSAFDPIDIECISLIPFYTVVYRDASIAPMLEGKGEDPALEDKRYEAIEGDGDEAVSFYKNIALFHSDDPYAERQLAAAEFMLGKAYIDGLGDVFNPKLGYRKIYDAAVHHGSAEAANYLLANADAARSFMVDVDSIELLSEQGYFKPTIGNLCTPKSHCVPLLLPKK